MKPRTELAHSITKGRLYQELTLLLQGLCSPDSRHLHSRYPKIPHQKLEKSLQVLHNTYSWLTTNDDAHLMSEKMYQSLVTSCKAMSECYQTVCEQQKIHFSIGENTETLVCEWENISYVFDNLLDWQKRCKEVIPHLKRLVKAWKKSHQVTETLTSVLLMSEFEPLFNIIMVNAQNYHQLGLQYSFIGTHAIVFKQQQHQREIIDTICREFGALFSHNAFRYLAAIGGYHRVNLESLTDKVKHLQQTLRSSCNTGTSQVIKLSLGSDKMIRFLGHQRLFSKTHPMVDENEVYGIPLPRFKPSSDEWETMVAQKSDSISVVDLFRRSKAVCDHRSEFSSTHTLLRFQHHAISYVSVTKLSLFLSCTGYTFYKDMLVSMQSHVARHESLLNTMGRDIIALCSLIQLVVYRKQILQMQILLEQLDREK